MDENSIVSRAVTYSEMLDFLNYTKRSLKCPTCGQEDREWRFHLQPPPAEEQADDLEDVESRPMAIFRMPIVEPGIREDSDMYLPVMAIECDQCSHMEFINAFAVERYRNAQPEGAADE